MAENALGEPVVLDFKEIIKIIPHRYPFLLVDKVIDLNLEQETIVAIKSVSANEAFFQGHFPGHPIMPGVLILEALAQAGGILFHKKEGNEKVTLLLGINNAKFRNPVHPGDTLILHGHCVHSSSTGGRLKAKAMINNEKLACEAEILFALVSKEQI